MSVSLCVCLFCSFVPRDCLNKIGSVYVLLFACFIFMTEASHQQPTRSQQTEWFSRRSFCLAVVSPERVKSVFFFFAFVC